MDPRAAHLPIVFIVHNYTPIPNNSHRGQVW